jgi:pimeloyl-ACP methyl ester carboxylesterase
MGAAYPRGMWHRVVPALATRHRVLWYDNRGIGDSVPLPGPYSMHDMARDAIAVLDAAGVDRAHVFGVSLGGVTAQEIALAFPDRVTSLILGCTGVMSDERAADRTSRQRISPALRILSRVLPMNLKLRLAVPSTYGPLRDRTAVAADLKILRANLPSAAAMAAQEGAVSVYRAHDRIGGLTLPTLVLHGDADKAVPIEWGRKLADAIPGAEFITYPGAGHNFMSDRSNADVMAFIDRVDAGTADTDHVDADGA